MRRKNYLKRSQRSPQQIVTVPQDLALSSSEIITVHAEIVNEKSGRASVFAAIAMAFLGILLGAGASYMTGQSNQVEARYSGFQKIASFEYEGVRGSSTRQDRQAGPILRDDQLSPEKQSQFQQQHSFKRVPLREGKRRQKIVNDVLRGTIGRGKIGAQSFAQGETLRATVKVRPRIAIIFDDMGLDKGAFSQVMSLPGPLTLSFLPYARDVQPLVDQTLERGDSVLLHLPMEPIGPQDPGPYAIQASGSSQKMLEDLEWNLKQFSGYSGVNNHMGSKVTANQSRMTKILKNLKRRDLYFIDSVTSANTKVLQASRLAGMDILRRDVFVDPRAGVETVKTQLGQVEEIARRTGYAVAIAHPHKDTINVIGPWLASARLRGFELVTADRLMIDVHREKESPTRLNDGIRG